MSPGQVIDRRVQRTESNVRGATSARLVNSLRSSGMDEISKLAHLVGSGGGLHANFFQVPRDSNVLR